jgi:hypothetical protein
MVIITLILIEAITRPRLHELPILHYTPHELLFRYQNSHSVSQGR